jgi:hypothetical protein
MKLSKKLEEKVKKEVSKALEKGRPDWDLPHTLDSVRWMKKLVEKEGGNEKILVTAMYFHDIGYRSLSRGYSYEDIVKVKKERDHAKVGARMAGVILEKIGGYTDREIEKIMYLVKNHSRHDNLDSKERQLIFEADGLAQINWQKVPPNFDKKNCLQWMKKYLEIERPIERWRTITGRRFFKQLLKKTKVYWD